MDISVKNFAMSENDRTITATLNVGAKSRDYVVKGFFSGRSPKGNPLYLCKNDEIVGDVMFELKMDSQKQREVLHIVNRNAQEPKTHTMTTDRQSVSVGSDINANTAKIEKAFYNRTPIRGVTYVCFHEAAHNDELLASYILHRYGRRIFPGIENANLGVLTSKMVNDVLGTKHRDGKTFERLLQKGYLMVGTEGGPFDEHKEGMRGVSSSQLVAEYLGVEKNVELGALLMYSNQTDSYGDNGNWLDIENKDIQQAVKQLMPASQIKTFWRLLAYKMMTKDITEEQAAKKTKEFMDSYFRGIDTFVEDRLAYKSESVHVMRATTFKRMPKMGDVEGMDGHPFLAIVQDDSPYALQVVLDQKKVNPNIGLALIVKSTGNFALLPAHKGMRKYMVEVAKAIRSRVAFKKRMHITWQEGKFILNSNGSIGQAPEIYYDKMKSYGVYNGSNTQPDTPGLLGKGGLLSLSDLVNTIMVSVQTNYWPDHLSDKCSTGKLCPAKGNREIKCPLLPFHLNRCAANRREQYRLKGEEGRNAPPPMTIVKDDSHEDDDQRMAG